MKKSWHSFNSFLSHYGFSIVAALLLSVISWYAYFNKVMPKYEVRIFNDADCLKKTLDYYDLNNDGEAELLELKNQMDVEGKCYLTIRTSPFNNRKIISQNNWDYSVSMYSQINVCDYDNDGISEVFFLLRDDSLLRLVGVKPEFRLLKDASVLFDKYVTAVHVNKKNFDDYYLYPFKFVDINNDGFKEIIFTINGGYDAFPRKVFYYDIKNDSLHQSPDSLLIQYERISCSKINGQYYILPERVSSPGNVDDTNTFKYHDWFNWVYLLKQSLQPAFNPIRLSPAYNSNNYQRFVHFNGKSCILSLNSKHYFGESLSVYSIDGKLIKKKMLNKQFVYTLHKPVDTTEYLATIIYGNNFAFLTKNFTIKKQFTLPDVDKKIAPDVKIGNFDSDEKMEYLISANTSQNKSLMLYDDNFSLIFSCPVNYQTPVTYEHSVTTRSPYHIIQINSVNHCLTIGYKFNKNYYFPYFFAAITALILFVLFQMAIRQRLRFIEKQNNLEKNLIESQLKIANRQMSPHFQLNVLNSVSYLFEKEKEKAHYYLGKYLKLVTQTMMNVDKLTTTIENEISFINNYLKLEQLRLNFKFNFSIDIDKNINQSIQIPRMLLFTFCENAVKHGLFHKKSKGYLNIKGRQKDKNTIVFIIEDDGIGRLEAKKIKTGGTRMGIKTLNRIIAYFNESGSVKIKYQLVDKEEGVKVIVELSLRN